MSTDNKLRQLIDEYASLFFDELPGWLHLLRTEGALEQISGFLSEMRSGTGPELLSAQQTQNRPGSAGEDVVVEDRTREVLFEVPQDDNCTSIPRNYEIAERILDTLGSGSPFAEMDAVDVDGLIHVKLYDLFIAELPHITITDGVKRTGLGDLDRFQYIQLWLRRSYESQNWADSIVALLKHPSQTYSFVVPIGSPSPVGFNCSIGGRAELSLNCKSTATGNYANLLSGGIETINAEKAVEKVEVLLKETIGATVAAGLGLISARDIGAIPTNLLKLEPNDSQDDWRIDPALAQISHRLSFQVPQDLNTLERHLMTQQPDQAFKRRLECLKVLLCSSSERAKELRNASCLLVDSYSVREAGMSVLLSFLCMEAVLLEKKDTESLVARLTEAVAYRLGKTAEERRELRRTVKNLYNTRSQFVHTGTIERDSESQRQTASELACRVLNREIDDLLGMDHT